MSYDYLKHYVRNEYATPPTWEGARFAIRLPALFAGRQSVAIPFAAWGFLLVAPTMILFVEDGIENLRQATAVVVLLVIGGAMLLAAGHFALQYLRVEGDASELVFVTVPLPPRRRRVIPAATIERIGAVQRGLSRMQRFHFWGRKKPNMSYQPWTVVVDTTNGERETLPLHLRPEQAERLAADLEAALEEARRLRAEQGGFRG